MELTESEWTFVHKAFAIHPSFRTSIAILASYIQIARIANVDPSDLLREHGEIEGLIRRKCLNFTNLQWTK